MKRLITIGVLSVIVFFFVGIIDIDPEFGAYRFFIKIPPSTKCYFSHGCDDLVNQHIIDNYEEYRKRRRNYYAFNKSGQYLGAVLIQLLMASIFMKFTFSKKIRFILLDIFLFLLATFMLLFNLALGHVLSSRHQVEVTLMIILLTNFVLFRLLRPVKKYEQ